jgi:hypothetical protein
MQIQTPGATSKAVWRRLEDYKTNIYSEMDNNDVYVEVCNITGRGILVSAGCHKDNSNAAIYVKLTIDGGTPLEHVIPRAEADFLHFSMVFMSGFATSCKVEMKGSAAFSGRYWVVTQEE